MSERFDFWINFGKNLRNFIGRISKGLLGIISEAVLKGNPGKVYYGDTQKDVG